MVWERCPSCGSHIWDDYDIMMAEIVQTGVHTGYSKPIGKEHIN
jgi:uncharacterized protein YbbK (DUF523 family)